MDDKVELHPAYEWTCPECGRDHFERAIVAEMSTEDMQGLREDFGIEDGDTGDFMAMPCEVTCSDCNAAFETRHFRQDEDGE